MKPYVIVTKIAHQYEPTRLDGRGRLSVTKPGRRSLFSTEDDCRAAIEATKRYFDKTNRTRSFGFCIVARLGYDIGLNEVRTVWYNCEPGATLWQLRDLPMEDVWPNAG